MYQLNRQIADVNAQSLVVAQLYKNGVLNHAEYASRSGELDRKVSELRSERRRILTEDEDDEIIESLKELNETIAEYVPTDSFDTDLFGQIVESITVLQKRVRTIAPTIQPVNAHSTKSITKRVAAYCRVSTKQDEQLNSYENQVNHYTERIHREPGWKLVGIYADKGITGTSMKKRDEFNKLIRQCKRGRVDMIIVKSISRFARNTLDCIKITRMLREIKVDVYFEEQNLHSIDPASEFYISIYGSIAQSESENISHNVAWGKAQSAKEGNVSFAYKSFLGYRQGADGNPEIDPAQAITVRRIYTEFLSGSSLQQIADGLTADSVSTPMGKAVWQPGVIQSILSNVKYKGDALLGKTYVEDYISKKVRINGGERPQYYVENNHPAIIDADTFAQVQEELARRASKRKVKQIGTTTEQGKYCGKYALTELLVCGECGTPYRRCTWTSGGQKRIV